MRGRPKQKEFRYQLYFKGPNGWLKGLKYTTLQKVCDELDISPPTGRRIMRYESKLCRSFKIELIS
jgi:hypothetical protein